MTTFHNHIPISHFSQWFTHWTSLNNLMIAGPCSAESYTQLRSTILMMTSQPLWNVLRLGIWKPRSRPGGFDGNIEALQWIKELKQEFDFKCAVEVATPEHVDLALEAKVDVLWIGARTVGLPFAVDDLANAIAGLDIPVLIKNPLSPDVNLWAGAVERFLAKKVNKLAIVHRGYSWPYSQKLRNWPMWSTVAQMKIFFPDITVLGDPSHIAGDVNLVQRMSTEALSFGCDGLMIETHPDPVNALSDAAQQIPLSMMPQFLQQCKKPTTKNTHSEINYWRMHIDEIDQQVVHLLKKRDEVTEKIALTKKDQQLQVVDYHRFETMLNLRKEWFQAGLGDEQYIEQVFNLLHERSIQRQLNILTKSEDH